MEQKAILRIYIFAVSQAYVISYGRTNKQTNRHRFRRNIHINTAYYYLILLPLLP